MPAFSQRFKSYPEAAEYRVKRSRVDLGWLKRAGVAVLIFCVIYGAAQSETRIGRSIVDGVHYILTTETDVQYVLERLSPYLPQQLDSALWKRVQTTVSRPADPLQYMLKPVDGKLTATYGWQIHPVLKQEFMHEGVAIAAPQGTGVRAAATGTVRVVEESAQFGKILIIEHSQDVQTVYGHLSEALVKPGDRVVQGQLVARVGKSGMTETSKLYFAISDKGKFIDPLQRIQGEFSGKDGK